MESGNVISVISIEIEIETSFYIHNVLEIKWGLFCVTCEYCLEKVIKICSMIMGTRTRTSINVLHSPPLVLSTHTTSGNRESKNGIFVSAAKTFTNCESYPSFSICDGNG